MMKKTLLASSVLAVIAFATPALAGPPFTCHVFEIGSAKSLPWGSTADFTGMRKDYDFHNVVADTDKLLTPSMPTLVRMETLRRAAMYASRDRVVAEQLVALVIGRVTAADQAGRPDAFALFDAGYVVEALNELEQSGNHMKTPAGQEVGLAGITQLFEARPMLDKSAALRPGDASIEFALALISRTPARDGHAEKARRGAKLDGLLASNLVKLQLQ